MGTTYQVTVKPKGTPLEDARDIRTCTFESTATDTDTLREEAATAILTQDVLSSLSFTNHWEIATITPLESGSQTASTGSSPTQTQSPVTAVKQAFKTLTATDIQTLQQQLPTPTKRVPFTFRYDGDWTTSHLVTARRKARQFESWQRQLGRRHHRVATTDSRYLHDACLHTVAGVDPSLHQTLATAPTTHHEIINIVTTHTPQVMQHFDRIAP